ncbi:11210_t:CDS:2 [Funneliformis geosporum]|uniref:11210_t:CDS:1 n=1 Tax=Funneliformis geosporum TaxID=1117311 RepID=A0A9W4SE53_9GLOM|nr:11210_t:CDS:2 [Funneliformis geosporum]
MSFTLWVKYNNEQSVSLEIQKGTVDKLKDAIKRRLNLGKVNNGRIILRKHEATVDLEPDEIVDQNFANTAKTPLQIFTTVVKTTFLVQKYDNEGKPLPGKFASYTMCNDNDYRLFLKSFEATGLAHISDDKEVQTVITSLENIVPGERYEIVASYITSIRNNVTWSQSEDKAMEDEVLLAVKNFLDKMFKLTVEIFPERIMYKNKIAIMEFDGILICGDQVFILEAKYKMTDKHIKSLIDRLYEFETNLKITDSLEFKRLMGKQYVGVACGTLFTDELRSESMNKGLVVVYPCGNRYKVEAPQELMNKVKVCTLL